jgi:RecA-family ATPase
VPIIPGLLYQHENVALVAVLKSGKTFTAMDLGLSVASGTPIFGNTEGLVAQNVGAVVYLSAEGHAGIPSRIDAWMKARGLSGKRIPFYYVKQVPKAADWKKESEAFVAAIRAKLGEQAVILIIIDTLARSIIGLDENATDAANNYLAMTEHFIQEHGCTVLTVAHASNKNQEKWSSGHDPDFRGTSAFGAGFDSTWTLMRAERGKVVRMAPHWAKNNDLSALRTFYFTLEPVAIDNGRSGAVLKLCDQTAYDDSWPASEKEAKAQAEKWEGAAYYEAVRKALFDWAAWPGSGSSYEWRERDSGQEARGGMSTPQVAEETLKQRLGRGHAVTQKEIEAEARQLKRLAGTDVKPGPLDGFVRARQMGTLGVRWALPVKPKKGELG